MGTHNSLNIAGERSCQWHVHVGGAAAAAGRVGQGAAVPPRGELARRQQAGSGEELPFPGLMISWSVSFFLAFILVRRSN